MVFTPIPNWDQIAQENIFPGESGGDYDAIFGYANRDPNSPFYGVRPSAMTVGQVVDFTQPSGAYGQSVKGQIGRVATPIGAYQVVGTTLRAAVDALGLDPNTPFDKNTQDMIGQWIYQNQGPEAWEAWGKGGGGGGMVMSTSNAQNPWAYMTGEGQDFPLFDPGMTPRDRLTTGLVGAGELLSALGAGSAPTFQATDRWMQGEAKRRATQQAMEMRGKAGPPPGSDPNTTIAWLQSQGHTDLVQAVSQGLISPADAMKEALTRDPNLPADPNAPMTKDQIAAANSIIDDFRTVSAPFIETNNAAQNIYAAAQGTGGTSDFTMAQQFAKLLDPTSVVREGELAAVMSSAGTLPAFLTRLQGELDQTGGKLSPQMKQEILTLTAQILETRRNSLEERRQEYLTYARRAGLDPTILPGLQDLPSLPPAPSITVPPPPPGSPLLRGGGAPGQPIPLPEDF